MNNFYFSKKCSGYLLISVLVFGAIGVMIISGLTGWLLTNWKAVSNLSDRERAFQMAEAGIDYYRWHLAHAQKDFQDGTGLAGPYLHNFYNNNGELMGAYELTITPPAIGDTIVTIMSRGRTVGNTATRVIEVKLTLPSVAQYAVVCNSLIRFGEDAETFGPIFCNGGVRFDGLAHNLVSSAVEKYDDPDHGDDDDDDNYEFGVHTHVFPVDPLPPASVPTRADVFMSGRQFPATPVDFAGFTADMSDAKTSAQNGGTYLASSTKSGYNIILKTNKTFDLERVDNLVSAGGGCSDEYGEDGWGTWSIKNTTSLGNFPIPANGLIFVEDDVWVSGQINNYKVTIVAGAFPETAATSKSITVNSSLLYTNYTGSDQVALFAQKNVNVGQNSDNDLRIDATLIAKNGRVGRYYYALGCGNHNRSNLTLYGMMATNYRFGFAFMDTNGEIKSGYANRQIIYDGNLAFSPPPYLPSTRHEYEIISWREVR